MSKKRDLYNMDEYQEDYNEMEDPEDWESQAYEEADFDGAEEGYPEMGGGGYMDEGQDFDYESEQNPAYQEEEDDSDYYNLYNPDFQRFLLKNGIIKFESSSSDDSDDSEDSEDSDSGRSRKKTSRKKSSKKKTTRKKRR